MTTPHATTDWANWLARWDAQQQRGIPDREERFTVTVGAVAASPDPSRECSTLASARVS